ncbi:alpha/beta-Hydrolases superfamily protein [Rhynchospora pubera]|uniref:Alpha/beta-Hydrolases superfamily protein n=1 Tax=Rhynchospora pubera TaxID=906938 RepID=A0AAV8FHE4_9POAL|nr:alpha/beta-Hydrolases superfamily protein [Rhynchospora pubera]
MPNKPPSPPMPWMARIQVGFLMAATDAARRQDGTVNRFLLSIIEPKTSANPKPIAGVRTSDITIDPTRSLWVRIFAPSDPVKDEKLPLVIHFHGGGFTFFSAATGPYDVLGRRVCREIRAVVLSVSYRLAPEYKCPAPYDDGVDVLRFLDSGGIQSVEILTGLDLDLGSCFLTGDSAGGNIIHHVARRWAASLDSWEKVRIKGIVALQPYFGGEERTEAELRLEGVPVVSMKRADWGWKVFLPEGADRNHEAAHVFSDEVEEAFPAAMVVVGGYDPLQDWQKRYYEMLKARRKDARLVEYPDAIHGFYVFPDFVQSGQVIEEMKAFIKDQRSQ